MKFVKSIVFTLLCAPLLLWANTPDSISTRKTITFLIKPTKNDFENIQKVLEYKTSKKLVLILDGIFKVNNTLMTHKDFTSILLKPKSRLIFTNEKASGLIIRNNYCEVKNGNIEGSGKSSSNYYTGFGILISGASNNLVSNVTLSKISGNSIFLMYGNQGCNYNKIINNKIINPSFYINKEGDEAGIILGYSGEGYSHNFNLIENNIIDGANKIKIGIGLIGHGRKNIFRNNTVKNCLNYGILAYESKYTDTALSETLIEHNNVEGIGEVGNNTTVKGMGIYLLKSIHSIVRYNTVTNTLRNSNQSETLPAGGIAISMSPKCTVEHNNISNSFMYGIAIDYSSGSSILNNNIANIRKSGIYLVNLNNVIISKNKIASTQESLIKGYFEHTSTQAIINDDINNRFKNQNTGIDIKVVQNSFILNNNIALYFRGTPKNMFPKYPGNLIKNNSFARNTITGSNLPIEQLVRFELEEKGNNFITNNLIKK